MGWGSGSEVAEDLIKSFKKRVKDKDLRKALYEDMIEALENHDWDTQFDVTCIDPVFDEVLEKMYPENAED